MITLSVTFNAARTVVPNDCVDVFWNVNDAGIASGEPDLNTPINNSPIPLFPSSIPLIPWLGFSWGEAVWLGITDSTYMSFETLPVCFGEVKLTGKATDSLRNYQAGATVNTSHVVNSTPRPPTGFTRGAYAASQQSFTFTQSPQLEIV